MFRAAEFVKPGGSKLLVDVKWLAYVSSFLFRPIMCVRPPLCPHLPPYHHNPEQTQGADILVTGTLGLAAPQTKKAMFRAAELVKSGGGKLLVDVNWRPVFWDDLEVARKEILAFLDMADIVKISDADLEYLYDMQFVTALLNPCAVSQRVLVCHVRYRVLFFLCCCSILA
jgi:sugar/nucleoside kinase (ribokinase family)